MLLNYLKIAWRNLTRDKFYVLINISCLAMGIGVCFVIAFYIQGELSYDNFHENKDRIYRLTEEVTRNGEFQERSTTAYSLAEQMESDIPEIQAVATVLDGWNNNQLNYKDEIHNNIKLITAESDFFDVFTFPLISGKHQKILDEPNTIVLSKSLATRIFGTTDIVGKELTKADVRGNKVVFTVKGVTENVPDNSHFNYDAILSFETIRTSGLSLDNSQFFNYALVDPDTDVKKLTKTTQTVALAHFGAERINYLDYKVKYQLLSEVYLSPLRAEKTGDKNYISIFSIIALFILIIAIINYTNLAIARSNERSKEVGVRKVIGASRFDLIKQFLGESILYSVLAIPLALLMVDLFLPYFNFLLNSSIQWNLNENYALLLFVSVLVLASGLLASIYPAFVLSSYKPVNILKGSRGNSSAQRSLFRKSLITLQFVISSLLIISTVIISKQLNFIQDRKLGFDKELMVSIDLGTPANRPSSEIIKSSFKQNKYVEDAALSFGTPGLRFATVSAPIDRVDSAKFTTQANQGRIDIDFVETMNMDILAGSNFDKNNQSMTIDGVIINRAAAKNLGWSNPQAAIGNQINTRYSSIKTIIAVVEDFHFKSLHSSIEPLIMVTDAGYYPFYSSLNVKLTPGNLQSVIPSLENVWEELDIGTPLSYKFLDDAIDQLYKEEQNIASLFKFFAFLSILISCVGLVGLTVYTTQKKTKEIGIRKVLGASVSDIITLISKEFIVLVIISFLIAVPITWYSMNDWLNEFAYKINIGLGIYIISGISILIIALLAVGIQSFKASTEDPVKSLKSE